jgi:hypothetical protein
MPVLVRAGTEDAVAEIAGFCWEAIEIGVVDLSTEEVNAATELRYRVVALRPERAEIASKISVDVSVLDHHGPTTVPSGNSKYRVKQRAPAALLD